MPPSPILMDCHVDGIGESGRSLHAGRGAELVKESVVAVCRGEVLMCIHRTYSGRLTFRRAVCTLDVPNE
ncbi:hypothetical protein MHPYR_470023 [uncultured Mycobacterium sp.]|uniref:Uncharacterized protein n=1 Tax=uncultured Mycobacterium sp. TaxID=171292 RepID=A0A1Y5PK37_9MYCO|nr:hypothetical protein MHPYR_470023 [uncultured Mycobacterium sp.]